MLNVKTIFGRLGHELRKELGVIFFLALFGVVANLSYTSAVASGPCPVNGGGCTNSCFFRFFGGCECTMVDCVSGNAAIWHASAARPALA